MYCIEVHDALTAADMRDALIQHPVKGTSAAVCVVNESRKTLSVKKMEQFSSSHNFEYKADGLRVWKCYGTGDGKYIPYEMLYVTNQVPTALQTVESQEFYVPLGKREENPVQKLARVLRVVQHCLNVQSSVATRPLNPLRS